MASNQKEALLWLKYTTMSSRVGISFQLEDRSLIDRVVPLARWAGVKQIDGTYALSVAAAAGVPVRVLRCSAADALDPPGAVAEFAKHDWSSVTHVQLACESARSSDWEWQRSVVMGLRTAGYRAAFLGCGFSTGSPSQWETVVGHAGPHFPAYANPAALQFLGQLNNWDLDCKHRSGLALDQYFYRQSDDPQFAADFPWTAGRDALVRGCVGQHGVEAPDVYITESNEEVGGWAGKGRRVDQMLATVRWVDAHDQLDPGLVARFYFTLSPNDDWVGYDFEPLVQSMADWVNSQAHKPTQWRGNSTVDLPVPVYDQLTDADAVNNPLDCGEECLRMLADYYGVAHETDLQIKAEVLGSPDATGYSYVGQLVEWLSNRGLPAVEVQTDNPAQAMLDALVSGWPSIYLRYFDLQGFTGGHFVVGRGYDPASGLLALNNPWRGVVDHWSADDVNRYSSGGWVIVVQKEELTLDEIFIQQWKSYKPDVAVNEGAAIFKYWIDQRRQGAYGLGVPTSQEFKNGTGVAQIFTNCVMFWDPSRGVTVK